MTKLFSLRRQGIYCYYVRFVLFAVLGLYLYCRKDDFEVLFRETLILSLFLIFPLIIHSPLLLEGFALLRNISDRPFIFIFLRVFSNCFCCRSFWCWNSKKCCYFRSIALVHRRYFYRCCLFFSFLQNRYWFSHFSLNRGCFGLLMPLVSNRLFQVANCLFPFYLSLVGLTDFCFFMIFMNF